MDGEGETLVGGEGELDAGLAKCEGPMPALGKGSEEINGEASLGYLVSGVLFENKGVGGGAAFLSSAPAEWSAP